MAIFTNSHQGPLQIICFMVTFTIVFYTGSLPTTTTRRAGSPLPPWDPENTSQKTPINLDPWGKKMLTENRVKIAKVLALDNNIWAELQGAKVIDTDSINRIKVVIKLKYLSWLNCSCCTNILDSELYIKRGQKI